MKGNKFELKKNRTLPELPYRSISNRNWMLRKELLSTEEKAIRNLKLVFVCSLFSLALLGIFIELFSYLGVLNNLINYLNIFYMSLAIAIAIMIITILIWSIQNKLNEDNNIITYLLTSLLTSLVETLFYRPIFFFLVSLYTFHYGLLLLNFLVAMWSIFVSGLHMFDTLFHFIYMEGILDCTQINFADSIVSFMDIGNTEGGDISGNTAAVTGNLSDNTVTVTENIPTGDIADNNVGSSVGKRPLSEQLDTEHMSKIAKLSYNSDVSVSTSGATNSVPNSGMVTEPSVGVAATEPSVGVAATEPSVVADESSVAANQPSVAANQPSVAASQAVAGDSSPASSVASSIDSWVENDGTPSTGNPDQDRSNYLHRRLIYLEAKLESSDCNYHSVRGTRLTLETLDELEDVRDQLTDLHRILDVDEGYNESSDEGFNENSDEE